MNTADVVVGGIYRHFKGGYYQVIDVAYDHEDKSKKLPIVVYKRISDDSVWLRPSDSFLSPREVDGVMVERFTLIDSARCISLEKMGTTIHSALKRRAERGGTETIILCCAILGEDKKTIFTLPRPNRYHHILHKFSSLVSQDPDDQGFLTSEGRWVNREEAYQIASKARQVIRDTNDKTKFQGDIFFSEDLW